MVSKTFHPVKGVDFPKEIPAANSPAYIKERIVEYAKELDKNNLREILEILGDNYNGR